MMLGDRIGTPIERHFVQLPVYLYEASSHEMRFTNPMMLIAEVAEQKAATLTFPFKTCPVAIGTRPELGEMEKPFTIWFALPVPPHST
jgi:hypothetical protein